jgi:hypothetical protein
MSELPLDRIRIPPLIWLSSVEALDRKLETLISSWSSQACAAPH